jgi:serine/threonine-protein kinase
VDHALAPGERLGRYVIEDLLGAGGMGEVYRARDTQLRRAVAIKLVTGPLEGADAEEAKTRLLREAQATAALSHDHVVAVHDVGEHEGRPYIVMELLAGRTLRHFVGDASVPLPVRIAWLHDIAAALHAAHQKGIVHRDIKPENVFVRENGSVKVLDFGVARRFAPSESGDNPAMPALTGKGNVVGTPQYMSPEQMNGEELDGRSDQFAWAMLAYELLGGRYPFATTSAIEAVAAVLTQEPPPLAGSCPDCPPDVALVVARALSKSRGARFETMQPIIETLAPFADKAPRISVKTLGHDVAVDAPTVPSDPQLASAPTLLDRRSGKTRPRIVPLVLIGIAVLVAVGIALRLRRSEGVPITSVPVPRSANADADRAYRAGLQAARDAAGSTARAEFQRALALDANMVAAHVWLAQMQVLREPAQARKHLSLAAKARSALDPRDADALWVLEPLLLADPGDAKQSIARLDEVLGRRQGDAAFQFLLAELRAFTGDGKATIAAAHRAFALDRQYAAAWLAVAWGSELDGDDEATARALERCIEVSPLASSCRLGLVRINAQEGRCDRVVDETKSWLASSPEDAEALRARAEALASRDLRWTPAVDDLLAASRKLLPEHDREIQTKIDGMSRALFDGKLEEARTLARAADADLGDDPSLARHAQVAEAIVTTSLELGDTAGAATAAETFVSKTEIWVAPAQMWRDPTMHMLAVLRDAGRLAPADFVTKRDAWVRAWQSRPSLRLPTESWVFAFASVASSSDDARVALDAEPKSLPPARTVAAESALARVSLLGGRGRAGIDHWKRAASSCHAATEPALHIEASVELGDALRASGDQRGACAAYGAVMQRWAAATTSSALRRAREGHASAACP